MALNTVYNNYLSTYTPKAVTKYDTHKKSELRKVYNSIVKMNKDAPWYLPTTSRQTQQYAVDLKENARDLHNTIAQLGGLEEGNSLLSKKRAYSSDEDIVKAAYIGPQRPKDEIPDLQLEVRSLASSQENLGYFLPDEKVSLAPDTYSFDVGVNDMNYEFQFTIGESETNREIQERLVRLINNSDIGLKASLAESEGRTSIRLTSESTGLSPERSRIFTVSDSHTSKSSGTVDYFGLDYVSRDASNAQFLLNGEERTSSSNHFTIGKMFDVQLTGISPEDETVQIGLKTDVDSLTDNVTHLISGYNGFIKAASTYLDSQAQSRKLVQEFKGIAAVYRPSMESMGMNIAEDGTLNVNRDQLKRSALQADNINETFAYLKSFSTTLLRKSDQVSLNPMDYVDKTMVAYKNPIASRNYVSPYSTSAYTGMMFNSYC
ncbi:MAG: flagellar capping protein [Lachnospiraceae bacterium]|nr:flagellar capping protein [Lachnospiraceae bacterium]MCM1239673.1 flagellar capping protein [Lachnospiraceae bacterium]MCM1302685.1 flagellar capping protein [Butyrivibrio sp.]MCM1342404.1 hypothetical protein [Muribaculaceae bacterium]MCM1410289.1 flagellar capping protein [Lachnospiraceae bacterium]